jgi:site-specific recombinase XerD
MKLSEAGLKFLQWSELEKDHSQKTVLNYEHHFRHFFEWAGDIEIKSINEELILRYNLPPA